MFRNNLRKESLIVIPREEINIANNNAKLATQPGAKFTDFEVTYDGKTHRLSDVVGKGKPVLVDFWASWCGPCRREMPNLKAINEKYGDRLKVLGVAVWDEPDDTLKAVKELGLPWEIWVNGKTAPTDAYGINGSVCLVSPLMLLLMTVPSGHFRSYLASLLSAVNQKSK